MSSGISFWDYLFVARAGVKTGAHAVHVCVYHFVWATKYRRAVLDLVNPGRPEVTVSHRLTELLAVKAGQHGWIIRASETMPDHVHVFVQADNVAAPHYIATQLKGFTSRVLREEFPVLRSRLPCLWTRSYFVATAGDVSAATIEAYIANQRTRPVPG